jgi:hypothetical protein
MIFSIFQALKAIYWDRILLFLPIWSAVTAAMVISAGSAVAYGPRLATRRANTIETGAVVTRIGNGGVFVALVLLGVILLGYAVFTFAWEDFANYDEAFFTLYTLKGIDFPPPIWPALGRFFPLGFQEFNLVRHVTHSVAGYHAIPFLQLLAVIGALWVLDDEMPLAARAALAAFLLVLPSFVTTFTGLVFQERDVVFWLVCLLIGVKRFDRTRSVPWAVAAIIGAQFMLYYKETASLMVLSFAIGRLVLRDMGGDEPNRAWLWRKESRLDFFLILSGVGYLLFYLVMMFPRLSMQYDEQLQVPLVETLLYYAKIDWLAWLFACVGLARAYLILGRKIAPDPFWDALALSGIIWFVAYLYLRLTTAHYLAPVDLIATLYVGRLVVIGMRRIRAPLRAGATIIASVLLVQAVVLSAFMVYERKNVVYAKMGIAGVIAARDSIAGAEPPRLFFPFANSYHVTEFASYLNYRGVSVEGSPLRSATHDDVLIAPRVVETDGKCVSYRPFICHADAKPKPGDLVIELPDDAASRADEAPLRENAEMLASWKPFPRIPEWLFPLIDHLRIASAIGFEHEAQLPDRWLGAAVMQWK